MRGSTSPCSRAASGRANSTSASPRPWTASTSPAGGAGCLSSRCRKLATLGTGGLLLMLALAIPAFRQTSDDDWLKKSDLAVTFLDRYGNEIGSRGIKHNDSVPLDEMPDHLIKAMLATEDRRFYEHFGIDFHGTFRALVTNAQAGGVVQGGSTITQQLAKNLFLSQRAHHRAQDQRSVPRAVAGTASDQERDPQALSRPRLSRRRRVRRRRGGAVLFRQVGARRDPARSGDARRHCSRRRPNSRRWSICRRRARAPTSCSTIWSTPAS